MVSVLFISEYFPPVVQGGGEINLSLVGAALAESGAEVTVLTSWFPGLLREERVNGVKVLRWLKTGRSVGSVLGNVKRGLFFERSVVSAVTGLVNTQRCDVIHLIGSALGCAGKLKKIVAAPLVATVESYIALCPKGDFLCGRQVDVSRWSFWHFVRCLLRSDEIGKMKNHFYIKYNPLFWFLSYRRFAHLERNLRAVRLVAISRFVQDILKGQYGLDSIVVPNFIDGDMFQRKKMKNEKSVVAYLGALAEHKGPQVLLNAVVGLDCRVEMYGDGPLKEELLHFIKEKKLDAEINAPVPYDTVPEIYARADIVVFPSLWPEPFGRIAIEALAAGVPVVASRIGGIEETVPPGTGILVEPGDVKKLRNALQLLLERPAGREEQGMRGRDFAKENYSKNTIVACFVDFYAHVGSGALRNFNKKPMEMR